MKFDQYAALHAQGSHPELAVAGAAMLAGGFIDECAVAMCQEKPAGEKGPAPKDEARRRYLDGTSRLDLALPSELKLDCPFEALPIASWVGLEIDFTLSTPWYAKDDRPFHVLDNPVRKDRVFGVPYIPASTWKGLLRWACRMQAGLLDHLERHNIDLEGWTDPGWLLHLFGNEKGEDKDFSRGALVFRPTWFSKVGFEVINPHSRARRAGTQPIYYEVVPANTSGSLRLLYAPLPDPERGAGQADALGNLVDSVGDLLESYGMSAKRSAGWGTAHIDRWQAMVAGPARPLEAKHVDKFKEELRTWLSQEKDAEGPR
jgi:CRISPR-associated protein Cmr2